MIDDPNGAVPNGLRPGQSLIYREGGVWDRAGDFTMVDATLDIRGIPSDGFENPFNQQRGYLRAAGSEIIIADGAVPGFDLIELYDDSTLHLSDIDWSLRPALEVYDGSEVIMSSSVPGGTPVGLPARGWVRVAAGGTVTFESGLVPTLYAGPGGTVNIKGGRAIAGVGGFSSLPHTAQPGSRFNISGGEIYLDFQAGWRDSWPPNDHDDAVVTVSGGKVWSIELHPQSVVEVSGDEVGISPVVDRSRVTISGGTTERLDVEAGGIARISGGMIEDGVDADAGSTVSLLVRELSQDGEPIALTPGVPTAIETSGVFPVTRFAGVLADGTAFDSWSIGGQLTAELAPHPADLDVSGRVDVFDLLAYISAFVARDSAADMDGTGTIDVFDLLAYISLFAAA